MISIEQMRLVFETLVCDEADKMLPWSRVADALSQCKFNIKVCELEFLSLKTERLSFVQFHATVKSGVTQRKKIKKIYAGKRLQTYDEWADSYRPPSPSDPREIATYIRDHDNHGALPAMGVNNTYL